VQVAVLTVLAGCSARLVLFAALTVLAGCSARLVLVVAASTMLTGGS
jgi:hypothetical protein